VTEAPDTSVEQIFKAVVDRVGSDLKPLGFTRRGRAFRRLAGGNAAVIEFQRSQSNTKDLIRFTVNLGVISGRLIEDGEPDVAKA
jgi:hypothetical protein